MPMSELIPKRKPTTLEPLPFEIENNAVKYERKRGNSEINSRIQGRFKEVGSTKSKGSHSRQLQIKGMTKDDAKKDRFNEEVEAEVKSIRQAVVDNINNKLNALGKRSGSNAGGSVVSGSKFSASQRLSVDFGAKTG